MKFEGTVGLALRQYFFSNLHERLCTHPFLSQIAKRWLAFQLIHAVEKSHSKGVCHGKIKCENVLVTSWNWLYLADFASFKPTYIPDDDPSDFSFYLDTGERRRCYLAPEVSSLIQTIQNLYAFFVVAVQFISVCFSPFVPFFTYATIYTFASCVSLTATEYLRYFRLVSVNVSLITFLRSRF